MQKNLSNLSRSGLLPGDQAQELVRPEDWEAFARQLRLKRRRQRLIRLAAWLIALIVAASSFAVGLRWYAAQATGETALTASAAAVMKPGPQALRLIDDAVRARYEERWQGAMNALAEARRASPDVRGVDVLVAEIALEQKDAKTLRAAAEQALRRGHNVASANLLLALESWMKRGEEGAAKAGDSAKQLLGEALEGGPSNAAAYFFRGELSRLLGDGGEAHRNMLAALHRQVPWMSSSLLLAKLHLAAREASEAGRPVAVPLPDGRAEKVLALREAVGSSSNLGPAVDEMVMVMPTLQAVEVLGDDAFRSGRVSPEFVVVQTGLRTAIPHGLVEPMGAR